jgi:hypothetical protein
VSASPISPSRSDGVRRKPFDARLQLAGRSWGLIAWLSLIGHAGLLVFIVLHGRALLERAAQGRRAGGGAQSVQFFTLTAPAMEAVDIPAAPAVSLSVAPPVDPIAIDLIGLGVSVVPPTASMGASARGGAPGGAGAGVAGGTGGSGTGDEERYIFPPNPRGVIVPPEKAPKSVRGRRYRATFWVGADGRVDRVDVSPPIEDAEYRQALQERLMDFAFYPARNRAGLAIPGIVPIVFAIP